MAKWMLNGFKLCFKICTMTTAKNCLFDCLFQTQSDFGWTWEGVAVSLVFPTGISRRKWWVWPTSLWILWRQPPPRRDLVLWWSSSIVHCVMISLLLSWCPWRVCLIISIDTYFYHPDHLWEVLQNPCISMESMPSWFDGSWHSPWQSSTAPQVCCQKLSQKVCDGMPLSVVTSHIQGRQVRGVVGGGWNWKRCRWVNANVVNIHLQIVTRMHIVHILVHAS